MPRYLLSVALFYFEKSWLNLGKSLLTMSSNLFYDIRYQIWCTRHQPFWKCFCTLCFDCIFIHPVPCYNAFCQFWKSKYANRHLICSSKYNEYIKAIPTSLERSIDFDKNAQKSASHNLITRFACIIEPMTLYHQTCLRAHLSTKTTKLFSDAVFSPKTYPRRDHL